MISFIFFYFVLSFRQGIAFLVETLSVSIIFVLFIRTAGRHIVQNDIIIRITEWIKNTTALVVVGLNKLYKRERCFLIIVVAICWNVDRILLACSWLYAFITNSLLIPFKRVAFINTTRTRARKDINERSLV